MKIIQFITSLGYGGAERLIADIAPKLKQRGVDVAVISLLDQMPLKEDLERAGVPVYSLRHSGTIYSVNGLARSFSRFRILIEKLKPDIVHSHLYLADILSRISTPKSCRLITTLHGRDDWWLQSNRIRSIGKTWLDRVSGKMREVRFISVSSDVRRTASTSLRIPKQRHRIVANGIVLDRFEPRPVGAQFGRAIIQVGRFYPEKNHLMALRAFVLVLNREPSARLILVGDGPLREQLQEEAKRLNINHAVVFMGVQSDIAGLLRGADIFWMTSHREGMPMACIEAMACGLPSVVTAVGGLPELVIDGKTGRTVASNDHQELAARTLEFFSNPTEAAKLGLNARLHVERSYAIEFTADRYMAAYQELIQGAW